MSVTLRDPHSPPLFDGPFDHRRALRLLSHAVRVKAGRDRPRTRDFIVMLDVCG